MTRAKTINRCLVCFLFCVVVVAGNSCRFPWSGPSAEKYPEPPPRLLKLYRQAVIAYQAKEYGVAAKRFKSVQEQAHDSDMARSATFGLACTQLMAAQTPRQYREALAIWETWAKKAPTEFEKENPMLMMPLIEEKMLFSNIPLTPDGRGDIEASPMVPQWLVINASKEIKQLKEKLETTSQSNHKLKERIGELEKQMTQLQQKIKALETIDQKIQKKKRHSVN